jgi:DNA-binding GntR family transcriptional regulator
MPRFDKRSLVDLIYEDLRRDILSLKYPFGGKINVNKLQSELEVSCTPIREAINRLQQEGLITYKNKVGAQVLSIGPHDVKSIQELAMTLHCAAIKYALLRGDHTAIVIELKKYRDAFSKAKSPEAEVSAVNQFVGVFYHNCGNERLDNTMISIQGLQLLLRNMYARAGANRDADLKDFDMIIKETESGNSEKVCEILQSNADRLTEKVLSTIS